MGFVARIGFLLIAIALVGCDAKTVSSKKESPEPTTAKLEKPIKIRDDEHLHNVFKVHEKVLSGGQPHGDEGFKALKELGVKTVISVDGAKPDVERAKKYGLRYVHLPHGYDGVPESRVRELAKAVRDLDGLIYIHCHHGKHRSPAATAVACVAAGFISPASALGILEAAGTSNNYRGLYQSAEEATKLDQQLLDALEVEFKEVAEVPAMADAMVEIEHRHDHLKQIAQNQWRPLPAHPDLEPAHEALMLREHFTELLRSDDVNDQPAGFQELLREGEQHAQALEDSYRSWESKGRPNDLKPIHAALAAVNQNCAACHKQFRDVPLNEKAKR